MNGRRQTEEECVRLHVSSGWTIAQGQRQYAIGESMHRRFVADGEARRAREETAASQAASARAAASAAARAEQAATREATRAATRANPRRSARLAHAPPCE